MKKNILIIYTAVGKGHKSMAENIAAALRATGGAGSNGAEYSVDTLDLFELQQSRFIDGATEVYLWILNKIPWLWEFFYTSKFVLWLTMPWRTPLASLKSKKVLKVLQSKHYDAVITTQVNASAIISYLKSKKLYTGKFIISFSDPHLQIFWLFKNADGYLVNVPETKAEMARLGYDPAKIFVVGMALPAAAQPTAEQMSQLRQKYGLVPDEKLILMMGGTMGYKIDAGLIQRLVEINPLKTKVFVVCGTNAAAKNEIDRRFAGNLNIKTFAHINFLPELYAVANIVVSKPGGMTVAECLQRALPVAVYTYLPGQEKINTAYLRSKNLVLPETGDLVKQVAEELRTGAFAAQLRANAAAKAMSQGSSTVAQAVGQLFHL